MRRPYVAGETASLTAQGFCKRCGLHVTEQVESKLNPHLHRCALGEVSWAVAFPYAVSEARK